MRTRIWIGLLCAWTLAACDPDDGGAAQPGTCSFETCNGCCDGDRCVVTQSDSACGQPGEACRACEDGNTCASGQCVPVADCSDCDGCCFEGRQCLPGNSLNACGSGGEACSACGSGTGCSADTGSCEPIACDASNCDGCCTQNGVCLTAGEQALEACGSGGEACGVCPAAASSCSQGTCVVDQPCLEFCTDGCCTDDGQCIPFGQQEDDVCGGSTGPDICGACNPALSCVSGACVADLAWKVTAASAVIAATKSGAEWDQALFSNPLPDAYIGLSLGGDTFLDGLSPTIDNTLTPNWNHSFGNYLQSDLIAKGLLVNIRDSDGLGVFETIGNCNIAITAQDITAGFVIKPTCGFASNVRITFTAP